MKSVFRTFTFLYLPAYNFWLLLCPERLSYDWQMGSLPLINLSVIRKDPTYVVVPLFYGSLLWFIFISLKSLLFSKHQTFQNNEADQIIRSMSNVAKFLSSSISNLFHRSKNGSKNVSMYRNTIMIDIAFFVLILLLRGLTPYYASYTKCIIINDHLSFLQNSRLSRASTSTKRLIAVPKKACCIH